MHRIYNPSTNSHMSVAVFLSGSGTNFEALYNEQKRLEKLGYVRHGRIDFVFTDVPECRGVKIADKFGIPTRKLSSEKIFKEFLGLTKATIDGGERAAFDILSLQLMEDTCQPDLICLAGYERWLSPYFVQEYRNKILNAHPGDSSRGYIGLAEVPTANAILNGEGYTRSTIFLVNESKDGGHILVQSHPIHIFTDENSRNLEYVKKYAQQNGLFNVGDFKKIAKEEVEAKEKLDLLLRISREHQSRMKERGDWPSYKFAVHHLIAQGRVSIDGRDVYIDGNKLPSYGFRLDEHQDEFERSGIII